MVPFTVTTQLTQKDFINFNKLASPFSWVVWVFFALGIFMLLTVALRNTSEFTAQLPFPFTELFVGLVLASVPFLLLFNIRRNFKNNTSLHGPISYTFTEKGLEAAGETFTSSMAWEKVQKVTENKQLFVIWQNPQMANILPKRFFEPGQLDSLRALA